MRAQILVIVVVCCGTTLALLGSGDTVLQFFEWKYTDIANECEDWLVAKKFAAIQVSPFTVEQIPYDEPWYKRYSPLQYIMDTRSGNSSEFKDMVQRCTMKNIKVIVDVSINSQADPVIALGFKPLLEVIPKFHFIEASNIYHYLNYLTSYGVAGFYVKCNNIHEQDTFERIFKTILPLNPEFGFDQDTRPVILLETVTEAVKKKINLTDTTFSYITEDDYAVQVADVFAGTGKLKSLKELSTRWDTLPTEKVLVYVDHRGVEESKHLTSQSAKLFKMATAFSLAYPYGVPMVTSSYDFAKFKDGPPRNEEGVPLTPNFDTMETCDNGYVCEHRWRQVANMVEFRHIVGDAPIENWWSDRKNQIAFSRGNKGFVAFNMEGYVDLEDAFQTGLPKGTYCDVITGVNYGMCTGLTVKVDEYGFAVISLPAISRDGVLAIHIGNTSFIANDIFGMNE